MTNWTKLLIKQGWRIHPQTKRYYHPQRPSGLHESEVGDWGFTLKDALVRAGLKARTK